jgi:glycosyltransferase involved in cell wall biosynthesis
MTAASSISPEDGRRVDVCVVTVSYNTLELTALLLWSLHRVLDWPVGEILVIDNGSTDGSRELLAEAAQAGLCTLISNDRNSGHGPGLNEAMDRLRQRTHLPDRVWILDSDCVIARGDVLSAVFASPTTDGATIIGEAHWDPWHERHRFELYSLLIDATWLLHANDVPFTDDGDPAITLLDAAEAAGVAMAEFPFTAEHFLIHRGRGSLAAVANADDQQHPLYRWAVDHHEPHFGGVEGARDRYAVLARQFRADVGPLEARRFSTSLRNII